MMSANLAGMVVFGNDLRKAKIILVAISNTTRTRQCSNVIIYSTILNRFIVRAYQEDKELKGYDFKGCQR